jgi:6-phosphogluconolactonase
MPVGEDGRLGEASAFVQHTGSGANPKRQRAPHAHCIQPSPDGKYVLAADLGIDQLLVYRFANGALAAHGALKLKPGAGPRHFAFHPNRKWVYVINELDSTVTAANWKDGSLAEFQTIAALPAGFTGESWTAEVVVHPNGKFLYGSNRGHDSIAVFAIDGNGKLTVIEHTPTRGETPRNFALDPTGQFLFAANQKSGNVQLFRVEKTGRLTHTGEAVEVGSPVCVRFAPAG